MWHSLVAGQFCTGVHALVSTDQPAPPLSSTAVVVGWLGTCMLCILAAYCMALMMCSTTVLPAGHVRRQCFRGMQRPGGQLSATATLHHPSGGGTPCHLFALHLGYK